MRTRLEPEKNMPDALKLLATRRSFKPIELLGPPPTVAEINMLLTIASRVPDHGKLAPWRFIVFDGEARRRAGEKIAAVFRADNPQATADQIEFERNRLARAPLVVAVVSRAGPHLKIPEFLLQFKPSQEKGQRSPHILSVSKGYFLYPIVPCGIEEYCFAIRDE